MEEQIRELRAKGHTIRAIARALGIHRDTVRLYLPPEDEHHKPRRLQALKEKDLELGLGQLRPRRWQEAVDWEKVRQAQARGVSFKVLWQELELPVDYQAFWREFHRQHPALPKPTIRLMHKPGERAQIDYCDGIDIVDLATGETVSTQLFVGVLPFSSYTFAEFVLNQTLPSFIASQQNMFHFFGGVTPYVVPDNLKSGVSRAHRYDPDANRTYCEFGNHMGFAVLPARPQSPRDKGAVETAVGILQKTFFARVRDRVFHSLFDLNQALKEYLEELNCQVMKDYGVSRSDRFQEEKNHLQPLPFTPFVFSRWKQAKVHPDCHIQVEKNFYSVPHRWVGQEVRVRIQAQLIEVFSQDLEPIAAHARLMGEHRYATDSRHYPQAMLATVSFDIHQALSQAKRIGVETERLAQHLFNLSHPLKYLRRVQGILRLAQKKKVSTLALEHACKLALQHNNTRYATIEAIAQHYDRRGPRPYLVSSTKPERPEHSLFLHQSQPIAERTLS